MFLMAFAAAPETCWPQIPETRERKGSIVSARPVGEKIGQGWAAITALKRGSVWIRWFVASSRMVEVVVVGGGWCEEVPFAWELVSGGKAVDCVPPGVASVAFVVCGSVGRGLERG